VRRRGQRVAAAVAAAGGALLPLRRRPQTSDLWEAGEFRVRQQCACYSNVYPSGATGRARGEWRERRSLAGRSCTRATSADRWIDRRPSGLARSPTAVRSAIDKNSQAPLPLRAEQSTQTHSSLLDRLFALALSFHHVRSIFGALWRSCVLGRLVCECTLARSLARPQRWPSTRRHC